MSRQPAHGFTMVELLIVIVVVAILAAISIVAYTGVQERARDAQRLNHGRQISQALQLYALENPTNPNQSILWGSGCGWVGTTGVASGAGDGNGWLVRVKTPGRAIATLTNPLRVFSGCRSSA